jgi:multidrug efflux pump subunit AcrA (membrane-fusion protein)
MIAWVQQRKWAVLAVTAVVVAAGVFVTRSRSDVAAVSVAETTVGALQLRIAASGLVEAESDDLSFKGQGKIAAVYVHEGDRASYGEVLARIDSAADALGGPSGGNFDVIPAPCDGTVVEVYRREGAVVSPGVPVLRFVRDGKCWVTAFLDSDDAAQLRPGQRLQCRAGGYLSEAYELKIVAVGREAVSRQDMPGSARQVRVRCEPVSDRFPLVAGTEVDVDGEAPIVERGLLVPTAAVVHEGPRDWVWVVKDEAAHRREVQLGPNNFDLIEIRSGLQEGDAVVAHGKDGLTEGQRVEVERRESPQGQEPTKGGE